MDDAPPDNEFRRQFQVLATQYLDNLVARISGQLDNLLLFSALFSGINTAILVSVVPTAGDETNSILRSLASHFLNDSTITNFDPYYDQPNSPLTFSMTAFNAIFITVLVGTMVLSFFAMLGKQWIIGFKPEVAGSPEEGHTELDRKVIHSELFCLSLVMETAPFVLAEIILFTFLGTYVDLAEAHWTLGTSIPLSGTQLAAGLVLGATVIFAAFYEDWPYHNPINRLLPWLAARTRHASRDITTFPSQKAVGSWLNRGHQKRSECPNHSQPLAICSDSFPKRRDLMRGYFNVQCVCWVLEVCRRDDILRVAASMICTFKDPKEVTIILKRPSGRTLRLLLQKHSALGRRSAEYAAALLHILVASEDFLEMPDFKPLDALKSVKCRSTGPSNDIGDLVCARSQDVHFVDRTLLFTASLRCMTEYGVEWHFDESRFQWKTESDVARGLIESNIHHTMTDHQLQVLLSAINTFHEIFKEEQEECDDTAAGFHEAKHSLWGTYRSSDSRLAAGTLIAAVKSFANQDERSPVIISKESAAFRILVSTIAHHLECGSLADWAAKDFLELSSAVTQLIKSWVDWHPHRKPSGQVTDATMLQLLLIIIKRTAKRAEDQSRLSTGRGWDDAVVESFSYLADVCDLDTTADGVLRIQGLFDMSRRSLSRAKGPKAASLIEALRAIRSWAETTTHGPRVRVDGNTTEEFLENMKSLEIELGPKATISDWGDTTLSLKPLPSVPIAIGPVVVHQH